MNEEEKRNNFCGSIQEDKKTSVNTELQDSERTSWLNPDAVEFVPVLFLSLIHILCVCVCVCPCVCNTERGREIKQTAEIIQRAQERDDISF